MNIFRLPNVGVKKQKQNMAITVLECAKGELEYEQDVPGKVTEPVEDDRARLGVAWKIAVTCLEGVKISYGPWFDQQRFDEFLSMFKFFLTNLF